MILTTITPYWQRPQALRRWAASMSGTSIPEVKHLLYFGGPEKVEFEDVPRLHVCVDEKMHGKSIGYYHNAGARLADTEWIMKFDVDCIPNTEFFKRLIPVLKNAKPRQWFNCGMLNVNQAASNWLLGEYNLPLTVHSYLEVLSNRNAYIQGYQMPASTNFICRRADYLALGGCDPLFKGWGWEDYQQIYMLERHFLGKPPLEGAVDWENVTQRCRDEISRVRALELYNIDQHLCLLHHWHPLVNKNDHSANKRVLLDYILRNR